MYFIHVTFSLQPFACGPFYHTNHTLSSSALLCSQLQWILKEQFRIQDIKLYGIVIWRIVHTPTPLLRVVSPGLVSFWSEKVVSWCHENKRFISPKPCVLEWVIVFKIQTARGGKKNHISERSGLFSLTIDECAPC